MPCRVNRRRLWAHRITLEALQHGDNAFVTLTYNEENCPRGVDPKHTSDWLKRFRKAIEPLRIRYYLVGEYGDQTWRPHYHAAIFGYPSCQHIAEDKNCRICGIVRETWRYGHVLVAELNAASANYIAGYVTKKMVHIDDPRLDGRPPEFARMSLRPGLGVSAMHEVASQLLKFDLDETQADVPSALRHGGRLLPLGRHLRRQLRTMVGKDAAAPEATLNAQKEKLQHVFEAAKAASPIGGEVRRIVTREMLAAESDQAVRNMEARSKIFKQRKTL